MDFELCRGSEDCTVRALECSDKGNKSEEPYVGIQLQFIASQRVLMDSTLCLEMSWEKQ